MRMQHRMKLLGIIVAKMQKPPQKIVRPLTKRNNNVAKIKVELCGNALNLSNLVPKSRINVTQKVPVV